MSELRQLAEIKVNGRARQDIGDLELLVDSIKRVGLLHPIVIQPDGKLIAGQRRLEAFRRLGRTAIPVTVADSLDSARACLEAERDENTCRKDMTPSEKVALGRALEALERPKAASRRGQRTDLEPPENFTGGRRGPVRDLVGEAVGMSGITYERARRVVTLAEAGDPTAIEAREQMDATGKVSRAYQKLYPNQQVNCYRPKDQASSNERKKQRFQLAPGRPTVIANANKQRLWTLINSLNGISENVSAINLEAALAVTEPDELREMVRTLKAALAALGAFRRTVSEGGDRSP